MKYKALARHKAIKYIFKLLLGGIALLAAIYIFSKLWPATWNVYKNDELGFSFKYPKSWHLIGLDEPITISKMENLQKYNYLPFYVHSKSTLSDDSQDALGRRGIVEVVIRKDDSLMEAHQLLGGEGAFEQVKYGDYIGYTQDFDYWTQLQIRNNNEWVTYMKSFDLEANYFYYVNTVVIEDNNFISNLKARYYYWIGSTILDSFVFTKN